MSKEKRSAGIRALNAFCALVLLGGIVYVLVAGYKMMAIGTMALALATIAAPVVAGGEGILEVLLGVVVATRSDSYRF